MSGKKSPVTTKNGLPLVEPEYTHKLIAVYDAKSKFFSFSHPVRTVEEGRRNFGHIIKLGNSPISEYPEDFILYEVGSFNEHTGGVQPALIPLEIARGTDFPKAQPQDLNRSA